LKAGISRPTGVVKIKTSTGPKTEPCGHSCSTTNSGRMVVSEGDAVGAVSNPVYELVRESKDFSGSLEQTSVSPTLTRHNRLYRLQLRQYTYITIDLSVKMA